MRELMFSFLSFFKLTKIVTLLHILLPSDEFLCDIIFASCSF